jgi:hypothetical protein
MKHTRPIFLADWQEAICTDSDHVARLDEFIGPKV